MVWSEVDLFTKSCVSCLWSGGSGGMLQNKFIGEYSRRNLNHKHIFSRLSGVMEIDSLCPVSPHEWSWKASGSWIDKWISALAAVNMEEERVGNQRAFDSSNVCV